MEASVERDGESHKEAVRGEKTKVLQATPCRKGRSRRPNGFRRWRKRTGWKGKTTANGADCAEEIRGKKKIKEALCKGRRKWSGTEEKIKSVDGGP